MTAAVGGVRYLLDDGAQLEAEPLAQLPQVGEAAGAQHAVRVPGAPQEGVDQGLSVLDHHVPCKREHSGHGNARQRAQHGWLGGDPAGFQHSQETEARAPSASCRTAGCNLWSTMQPDPSR